jgi:hypothetical protein
MNMPEMVKKCTLIKIASRILLLLTTVLVQKVKSARARLVLVPVLNLLAIKVAVVLTAHQVHQVDAVIKDPMVRLAAPALTAFQAPPVPQVKMVMTVLTRSVKLPMDVKVLQVAQVVSVFKVVKVLQVLKLNAVEEVQ